MSLPWIETPGGGREVEPDLGAVYLCQQNSILVVDNQQGEMKDTCSTSQERIQVNLYLGLGDG